MEAPDDEDPPCVPANSVPPEGADVAATNIEGSEQPSEVTQPDGDKEDEKGTDDDKKEETGGGESTAAGEGDKKDDASSGQCCVFTITCCITNWTIILWMLIYCCPCA
jgi:hypothetical protein